ncbi:MAG: hypothetical protein ACI4U3_05230 [Traorella sp.]
MNISKIIETIRGEELICCNDNLDIQFCFATDLMSDALAMIHQNSEETMLITGLCNAQSIRSADMLDIHMILIVRGKKYQEEDLKLAQECNINVVSTPLTMFEACGLLYAQGLKNVYKEV